MRKEILAAVMFTPLLFSGCLTPHFYYSPNTQNVTLFKERNEFKGQAVGSIGVANTSFEMNAGYALTKNIALTAGYMTGGIDYTNDKRKDYLKNHYLEGGIGYYKCFRDQVVLEISTGYGSGSQNHVYARSEYNGGGIWTWVPDGSADMKSSKFFIQPAVGFISKNIEAAFSLRFSSLNFKEINYYNTVGRIDELSLLQENRTPWLIEPAFTLRGGSGSMKAQLQLILSKNLADPQLNFEPARFSFGIFFSFGNKYEAVQK